ncbi:MAG TPA: amidase [Casimicrobiaceae bacterium]|nr:amidase [Casimicrobiaceae bacterium]
MSSGLHAMSLSSAVKEIAIGALTARALAEAQLERIAATDADIQAWAHLDAAYVRRMADRCDAAAGGSLRGSGVGVKDIIATADLPTAMGSPVYDGNRPADSAECVKRLQNAGGYVFGKTVTTAFAFLDPGKTRNPWNPAHTPGGSSSGSAAAVAAGHVAGAIGTQTNGSVIRPAAFCGVIGFKPTKDAIPLDGVNVFSQTLDQIGVFTRSVSDAARLANALADGAFVSPSVAALPAPPRLAYLGDYPWTMLDCDADDTLEAAATRLRQFGATVIGVEFPSRWREAHRVLRTIMLYEGAQNLGSLQGRERARLGPKLNAALDEGRAIPRADYSRALEQRTDVIAAFTEWLEDFDAVVSPAAPGTAPAGLASTGDPSCCTLWSLTGFPALTIPAGLCEGLPVGMQIACPAGADDRLLTVAAWCESKLSFRGLL